jgi:hypothetical protein
LIGVSLKDFQTHKARALLVADPDCPPDLLEFVRDLLVTGGTGAQAFSTTGPPAHLEDAMAHLMEVSDMVVLLRSEKQPSREVLTAARVAKDHEKPIQVLVVRGIRTEVMDAEEYQIVDLVPPKELGQASQDLLRWAAELPKRYGHPL